MTFKSRYWATQIEDMRMRLPLGVHSAMRCGSSDQALERAVNLCTAGTAAHRRGGGGSDQAITHGAAGQDLHHLARTSFDGKDPAELGARPGA